MAKITIKDIEERLEELWEQLHKIDKESRAYYKETTRTQSETAILTALIDVARLRMEGMRGPI